MTTESEVKVYDKDDWGTHIGYDVDDTVNAWFGGGRTGANDVGAKSKSKIDDWEKDDFWFFGEQLMATDAPTNAIGLTDYWSAVPYVYETFNDLAWINMTGLFIDPPDFAAGNMGALLSCGTIFILQQLVNVTYWGVYVATGGALGGIDAFPESPWEANTDGDNSLDAFEDSTWTRAEVMALFAKTYEAVVLERDKWEYAKDYDSKADIKGDEVPFIEDPDDIYDS